jgi:putative oxidoreductase
VKYAFVIARVLLGLVFTVFGLNGFLHFFQNPPVPGLAGQFMGALLGSHYYVIAFGTEVIGGVLLLSSRYVPLALTLLGPVIVNILSFHMFLDTQKTWRPPLSSRCYGSSFSRRCAVPSRVCSWRKKAD